MKKVLSIILALTMVFSLCAIQASAAGKEELTFLTYTSTPAMLELYEKLIEEFNAQHDDYEFTLETIPWSEAYNKMVVLGEAHSMPDVFLSHMSWLTEFSKTGWIKNLDDYYEKSPVSENMSTVVGGILVDGVQKGQYGKIVGIPYGLNPHFMFVRTDWLEEVGLTTADLDTWEGIFDAAEKLTDAEKGRYGFTFRGGAGGFDQCRMYIVSKLGGRLYDDEGASLFSTPEAIDAFNEYVSLYTNGYAPKDSVNWGFAEQVQAFSSGLTGILNQNFDCYTEFTDTMEPGTWEMIHFPRSVDGNIYNKAETSFYCIGADTEYPEAAWEFIEWCMEPANAAAMAAAGGFMPPVEVNEDQVNEYVLQASEALKDPTFVRMSDWGNFPEVGEFTNVLGDPGFQNACMGKKTGEEVMNEFAEYLTKYSQKYLAENPDGVLPVCMYIGQQ